MERHEEGTSLLENDPELSKTKSFEIVRTYQEASTKIQESQDGKSGKKDDLNKEMEMDEHIIPLEELVERLHTNLESGMTSEEAKHVLSRDGPNKMTPPKTTPSTIKFLLQLFGGFSLLLWVGAILCLAGYALNSADQSNLYLGIVLILVVVITAVFSHYQDAKAGKVMDKFKNMIPAHAMVIRDGERQEIMADDLVVGDIVLIEIGKKIPADVRILESNNIKVDNSSLTGESEPQTRTPEATDKNPLETRNLAFYTTSVVEGSGIGIVVNTGDRTCIGRIAGLAAGTEAVETPIHKEIHHFIKIISSIAIILGIIFFIFGLFVYPFITNIVFVIGIIVANVPEGLLATVTVSLTLTSKRMARKHVLVKNLESVETLGSTCTICSDKTGTLTQNKMTVAHIWVDNEIYETDTPTTTATYDPSSVAFRALHNNACLCNNAFFSANDADKEVIMRKTKGDGSESALIKFAQPIRDIMEMRAANERVCIIPFNSTNKYQLTIHKQEGGGPLLLLMKGAPERIYARCSTILVKGQELPLNDEWIENIKAANHALGAKGERILGHCQFLLDPNQYPSDYAFNPDDPNFPMDNLCFVGLSAMIDPPRAQVPEAVRTCQEAFIKVIMVTGDQAVTAAAIAQQVGIIKDLPTATDVAEEKKVSPWSLTMEETGCSSIVITGEQLLSMSDEDLDRVLEYPQIVFARTSPTQKLRIVEGCQRRGEIVAVTGDGVNDSPALKKADIGIAMGITGSEVSQEAADMILLDDNFASIVKGVEEGRLIFDNLKKSIAYTLSSNIPEIAPFIIFILFRFPLALTTVLILCIDLGTDMVPAISLAYEEAEADIMKRRPRNAQTDKLVTAKLISFAYLQIGMIQALAGFYTFFVVMGDFGFSPFELYGSADYFSDVKENEVWTIDTGSYTYDERVYALMNAQTAYFVTIVLVQWADLVICKTRKLSLFQQGMRNMALNFGLAFETILTLLLLYVPFTDVALGTAPIHPRHFLPAIPFTYFIIMYDELRKFWIRTYPSGWIAHHTYY